MTANKLTRKLASTALAAFLAAGALLGAAALHEAPAPDAQQEQAGATWSRIAPNKPGQPGGGGYTVNGATWS